MHSHRLLSPLSPCKPATPPVIHHIQVVSWKCVPLKACFWCPTERGVKPANFVCSSQLDFGPTARLDKGFPLLKGASTIAWKLKDYRGKFIKIVSSSDKCKRRISVLFVRMVIGVVLLMSVSFATNQSPSWALSEENRIFLEAWRTIDRAYVDKTFNGQNWFRYRENVLRNEPMNTREETYMAIRKMVATLNDPFTRFLEPEKLKSLRSGTQSSLTGVGLSIGYPTKLDGFTGVVVISAAPGGPASRAGISPGDVIMAIDDASTENMSIYDAAELLQGPEGSSVELTVRGKDETKRVALKQSGTQSSLTGVGLSIGYPTKLDGFTGVVVISAAPGGPASRAGISPGDVIMAIDDASTENMSIYDAAELLQGPEGSSVELTVRGKDETKRVALKREKVTLNPVKARYCEIPGLAKDGARVGYIKLLSFTQNASDAVKEAIEALRSDGVNSFVLDLRDNSGGLFPEGIETAKIWLKEGVIVYICDSRGVRDIYDADGSKAVAPSEPLAVLVNKGTASASEILAGALKDNKRAVLFGEPTYGKGKIQSVFELSDGSGLAVTVARYETPAHIDIDKVGIIPDHPLPASFPKDENDFCTCVQDPSSACYLNRGKLFSR